MLDEMCGKDGQDGKFGSNPFPAKKRPPSSGGDCTIEASKTYRVAKTSSIMARGKMVVNKVVNIYEPAMNKILQSGKKPSGWNDDDLFKAILYNLYTAHLARMVKPEKPETDEAEVVEVDGDQGGQGAQDVDQGGVGADGADGAEEVDAGPEDPDDDIDHSVFTSELVEDMTLIAEVAYETFEEYEAKYQPCFLAFKLFNSRSADKLDFLTVQPLSRGEKDKGKLSSASRAAQQAEARARKIAKLTGDSNGGGSTTPGAGGSTTTAADVMEIATRLHMTKVLEQTCYKYSLHC